MMTTDEEVATLKVALVQAKAFLAEARDWGVGASNHYCYIEHGMLCDFKREIGPCDCGFADWERRVEIMLGKA